MIAYNYSHIQRLQYYSQSLPDSDREFRHAVIERADSLRELWNELGFMEVSVFVLNEHVCVYAETQDGSKASGWDWPEVFCGYLERWPGNRLAMPMIDVFHDGIPNDAASWRCNRVVEKRIGSIARLKPDWVSSYIYYHYQKQEESPDSFNSTYMIGLLSRLLFSYYELPASVNDPKRIGKLATKLSPDNWHAVMEPHFEPWEGAPEDQRLWSRMEQLL